MRRVGMIALLIAAAVIAGACGSHDKSGSPNVSQGTSNQTQQAKTVPTTVASPIPKAVSGLVTDSANVIDQSSRSQLEARLTKLKQRDKIDFAVVTVATTGNQSARDYSLVLARERKSQLENEGNTAGLLLLVAVEDRKWHIQVTRNLEDELTNEVLTELSPPMTDSFQQKEYAEGIIKYVNAVVSKLEELRPLEK